MKWDSHHFLISDSLDRFSYEPLLKDINIENCPAEETFLETISPTMISLSTLASLSFCLAVVIKITGVIEHLPKEIRYLHDEILLPRTPFLPTMSFLLIPMIIFSVGVIFAALRWYFNYRRVFFMIEKIPGPPVHPIPFLGHAGIVIDLDRSKSPFGTYALIYQMLSGIYTLYASEKVLKMWLGSRPFILLFHPDAVEAVLSSNALVEKSVEYSWLKPWLGDGLVTSNRVVWKTRRKILTPAFHFKILQDFLPVMNEQAKVLVRKIHRLHREGKTTPYPDVLELVTLCTLDTICETAMGISIKAQETDSLYVKSLHRLSKLIIYRLTRPWLWPDWVFFISPPGREFRRCLKVMKDFTNEVIADRKKEWIENNRHLLEGDDGDSEMSSMETTEPGKGKRRLAFLDLLLHQHLVAKTLTLEDVRDEVDTFMFAGHDTTAMALAWTIYMLGIHQDIQERVREEVDSIFDASGVRSSCGTSDSINNKQSTDENQNHSNNSMSTTCGSTEDSSIPPLITEDMMRGMKYLDCVMREVQRIYPTAPFIARELTEDVTVCGYRVPAGTSAGILTFLLHQNPSIFPNPVKFDPDRFLPENSIGRHPYAYVPFSAGPRNCIGQKFALMEQKIVLSSLVREFIFSSVDPRDKLIVVGEMVLRPVNGIRVNIRPRWGDKGQSERPISPEGERKV